MNVDVSPHTINDDAAAGDHSVYERGKFKSIDIGARMRAGHIDVAEGDDCIVAMVESHLLNYPRQATIVDIGSGSAVLSERLARALPSHKVFANDIARSNRFHAIERLSHYSNASVFEEAFEKWTEPADIFISWGSHHHLPHDYLHHIRKMLRPGGRFIVGDEFCPEYLTEDELQGGRAWIVDGYLFTSEEEEHLFRTTGKIPESVLSREEDRRNALWNWYRFVIDNAVKRKDWDVAVIELQIARDDLTTAFADEHKTSPLLLETELANAGFSILSRHNIGNRAPRLQSFVIYETALKGEMQ